MVLNFTELIFFVWLVVISIILYKIANHYKQLTKNAKGENLQNILEDIVRKQDFLIEQVGKGATRLDNLEDQEKNNFQKMSIIRFNPFKDTGGNQSFALAFLTRKGDGVILSNLYARTGSRWYIKSIKSGKSQEVELSKEEEEAIKNALKS